jgi:hypothetical protein
LAGHTKMAATGFTPISLYYTTTASAAPTAGNLVAGELALNNNDGKLFYKDSSGVVQTIATKATAALPTTTTGSGAIVLATSPTVTTPIIATTLGVGGATPSASGSGITFPATQSASSDANTLDDYEEGTWTPSFFAISGSATYTAQTGTYTKIGRQVTATFYINVNVSSSLTTQNVTGLPFTGSNTNYSGTILSIWDGIGGYCTVIGLTGAAVAIQLRSTNVAILAPVLNTLFVANGASIGGTITYFTS